jgi:dihydrolipoamide dehydrogenase
MVMGEETIETQLAIIGGGPGGYAAAFRAADMGMDVTLIDVEERPGGVCVYRGCIPSKALLYLAGVVFHARQADEMGIHFEKPAFDLEAIRSWKDGIVDRLTRGLVSLCKMRDVQLVQGRARFEEADTLRVSGMQTTHVKFKQAILATGSHPIQLKNIEFQEGGRVMDSTGALNLVDVPEKLLVVGAGYVGLEMGFVYAALGSKVTMVEMTGDVLPGVDRDLVRPLERRAKEIFQALHLNTKVAEVKESKNQVKVKLDGKVDEPEQVFDRVLVAIGRRPNSQDLGLEKTAIVVNEKGFIEVDEQQRTADERIYAIGDVVGGVQLAHKAMYEGRVAAEVIGGEPAAFDAQAIPAVVYTDPEVAWTGLMEKEAEDAGHDVTSTRFRWGASGRALTLGASEGLTKMILDADSGQILGMGIVGREAGELIAEGVLAIEMGALAEDMDLSIHPHPTLSETIQESAASFLGHPTHIMPQKKK